MNIRKIRLFLLLSTLSLVLMTTIDYLIGERAEFLNAYSVVQRLFGQIPSAGDSVTAQTLGASGEFFVVILVNLCLGGVIASIVLLFTKRSE